MPRPPKTTALDEALEKPHAARQDFAQACASMLAQRDLRAGEQALATWCQAAEAVKNEAYVVYDSTNVDYDDPGSRGYVEPHDFCSEECQLV
jgi:hypothetical protein